MSALTALERARRSFAMRESSAQASMVAVQERPYDPDEELAESLRRQRESRIRAACIPERWADDSDPRARRVLELASSGPSVVLVGTSASSGRLGAAAAALAASEGLPGVLFKPAWRLCSEVKATYSGEGSTSDVIGRASSAGLLVLADLGTSRLSAHDVSSILLPVVLERMSRGLATIVTTEAAGPLALAVRLAATSAATGPVASLVGALALGTRALSASSGDTLAPLAGWGEGQHPVDPASPADSGGNPPGGDGGGGDGGGSRAVEAYERLRRAADLLGSGAGDLCDFVHIVGGECRGDGDCDRCVADALVGPLDDLMDVLRD